MIALSTSPDCAASCHYYVCSSGKDTVVCKSCANTSGAYHAQHVVCYMVQRYSSAIKLKKVKNAFF